MSRKRGKLSSDEENYIITNVHDLTVQQIADAINRTTEPVIKFIKAKNLKNTSVVSDDQYERKAFLNKLQSRNYYAELPEMLGEHELQRFEQDWVEVMLQFRDNVHYTEEIQIKQWILLQILADRSMKSRREVIGEVDKLQEEIDGILALEPSERDSQLLDSLSNQLTFARDGMIAFTREHAQVLDKIKDIERGLKAQRDARIKTVEDSKTTFQGYLRILDDELNRKDAGDDAEIMRIAKNKAKERISKLHTFIDGTIDQPLLTPENSISDFEEQEYEVEQ